MATNSTRNISFEQAQQMWPGVTLSPNETMTFSVSPNTTTLPVSTVETPVWRGPHVVTAPKVLPMHGPIINSLATDTTERERRVDPNRATKFDDGKTQWHLIPWDAVAEIVKVMEFGAGKYSPWNWASNGGFPWHRLFNSSMRHFITWFWNKEDNDKETGLSHLAHLGCNVLFLLHYVLNKEKFTKDDRDAR